MSKTKSKKLAEIINLVEDLLERVDEDSVIESPKKTDQPLDRDTILEVATLFKEALLANGLHLRKHQGKFDFNESIRSTNRNFMNLMTKYFDYSKEEVEDASPRI